MQLSKGYISQPSNPANLEPTNYGVIPNVQYPSHPEQRNFQAFLPQRSIQDRFPFRQHGSSQELSAFHRAFQGNEKS